MVLAQRLRASTDEALAGYTEAYRALIELRAKIREGNRSIELLEHPSTSGGGRVGTGTQGAAGVHRGAV